jgi:putative transposase
VYRAPGAQQPEVRQLEVAQGSSRRLEADLHGGHGGRAELNLEAFARKWDEQLPTISKSWRLNWERLTPFMSYPAEIRRLIYTTNVIESVNSSLRKVLKNRGSFPNEDAVIKLVYLALRNVSAKWNLPIRD